MLASEPVVAMVEKLAVDGLVYVGTLHCITCANTSLAGGGEWGEALGEEAATRLASGEKRETSAEVTL